MTQVDNRSPLRTAIRRALCGPFVGGRVGAEAVKVLLTMEPGTLRPGRGADAKLLQIKRRVPSPSAWRGARKSSGSDPEKADRHGVDLCQRNRAARRES